MVTAIVAAAGKGRRFGAPDNKVFAPLGGKTVLHWSLSAIANCGAIDRIVIVTSADDLERAASIAREFTKFHGVCEGGAERGDSVWNALQNLPPETALVAVHDGARPIVTPGLIGALVSEAHKSGAAVPALKVSDTLKRSMDGHATLETVDRSSLFTVQTPQVFRRDLLIEAYRAARETGFSGTDDASYVERMGHPVSLVPGERRNIKITMPEDLEAAERELQRTPTIRTGFGYDVHRLVMGRRLVLGGVELAHPDGLGLEGHSDADVLLHAVADALLGAAALGDIGTHFPNTDERFRDISSLTLLREVARLIREDDWAILNVDAMLLIERPKISPHVAQMRSLIAEALGLRVDQVSVKATTNERLGFEGREEGIAAHAVATIQS